MKNDPSLDLIIGQTVTHVWFGDYSALYLELGELTSSGRSRRDGSPTNPNGEFTVYAGFDWRIERPRSVYGSGNCSKNRQRAITTKLEGASITSITNHGRLPELQIGFSNKFWLATFGLGSGDPDWSVSFNHPSPLHLCSRRGRLSVDRRDFDPPQAEQDGGGNSVALLASP